MFSYILIKKPLLGATRGWLYPFTPNDTGILKKYDLKMHCGGNLVPRVFVPYCAGLTKQVALESFVKLVHSRPQRPRSF